MRFDDEIDAMEEATMIIDFYAAKFLLVVGWLKVSKNNVNILIA
jgi:hypothetical protein